MTLLPVGLSSLSDSAVAVAKGSEASSAPTTPCLSVNSLKELKNDQPQMQDMEEEEGL